MRITSFFILAILFVILPRSTHAQVTRILDATRTETFIQETWDGARVQNASVPEPTSLPLWLLLTSAFVLRPRHISNYRRGSTPSK